MEEVLFAQKCEGLLELRSNAGEKKQKTNIPFGWRNTSEFTETKIE